MDCPDDPMQNNPFWVASCSLPGYLLFILIHGIYILNCKCCKCFKDNDMFGDWVVRLHCINIFYLNIIGLIFVFMYYIGCIGSCCSASAFTTVFFAMMLSLLTVFNGIIGVIIYNCCC